MNNVNRRTCRLQNRTYTVFHYSLPTVTTCEHVAQTGKKVNVLGKEIKNIAPYAKCTFSFLGVGGVLFIFIFIPIALFFMFVVVKSFEVSMAKRRVNDNAMD